MRQPLAWAQRWAPVVVGMQVRLQHEPQSLQTSPAIEHCPVPDVFKARHTPPTPVPFCEQTLLQQSAWSKQVSPCGLHVPPEAAQVPFWQLPEQQGSFPEPHALPVVVHEGLPTAATQTLPWQLPLQQSPFTPQAWLSWMQVVAHLPSPLHELLQQSVEVVQLAPDAAQRFDWGMHSPATVSHVRLEQQSAGPVQAMLTCPQLTTEPSPPPSSEASAPASPLVPVLGSEPQLQPATRRNNKKNRLMWPAPGKMPDFGWSPHPANSMRLESRRPSPEGPSPAQDGSFFSRSFQATRVARAMIVSCGFTPRLEGTMLPSAT